MDSPLSKACASRKTGQLSRFLQSRASRAASTRQNASREARRNSRFGSRAAIGELYHKQQPTNVLSVGSVEVGEPVVTIILLPMRAATTPLSGWGSGGSVD